MIHLLKDDKGAKRDADLVELYADEGYDHGILLTSLNVRHWICCIR